MIANACNEKEIVSKTKKVCTMNPESRIEKVHMDRNDIIQYKIGI